MMAIRIALCVFFVFLFLPTFNAASCEYCFLPEIASDVFMVSQEQLIRDARDYIDGANLSYKPLSEGISFKQSLTMLKEVNLPFNTTQTILPISTLKQTHFIVSSVDGNTLKVAQFKRDNPKSPQFNMVSNVEYTLPDAINVQGIYLISNNFDAIIDAQKTDNSSNLLIRCDGQGTIKSTTEFPAEAPATSRKGFYSLITKMLIIMQSEDVISIFKIAQDAITERERITKDTLKMTNLTISSFSANDNGLIALTDTVNSYLIIVQLVPPFDFNFNKFFLSTISGILQTSSDGYILMTIGSTIYRYSRIGQLTKSWQVDEEVILNVVQSQKYLMVSINNQFRVLDQKRNGMNAVLATVPSDDTIQYVLFEDDQVFIITSESAKFYTINIPLIVLTGGAAATQVLIQAQSGSRVCQKYVNIRPVADPTILLEKASIASSYKINLNSNFKLNLGDYYGGQSVRYALNGTGFELKTQTRKDFITAITDNLLIVSVLINNSSFYYAGFTAAGLNVEVCKDKPTTITCQPAFSLPTTYVPPFISGSTGGNPKVCWPFTDKIGYVCYTLDNLAPSTLVIGGPAAYSFSSIILQHGSVIALSRGGNFVYVGLQTGQGYTISNSSFSEEVLTILSGFYPRDIFFPAEGTNEFYIKLPKDVLKMRLNDGTLLQVIPLLDTFIQPEKWDVFVGKNSRWVVTTPGLIRTWITMPGSAERLNNREIVMDFFPPVRYNAKTNSLIVRSASGKLYYIKLGTPKVDEIPSRISSIEANYVFAGYFTILPEQLKVYTEVQQSTLVLNLSKPTTLNDAPYSLSLTASGGTDAAMIQHNSSVTTISYPMQIVALTSNSGLLFPQQAKSILVPVNVTELFKGPIVRMSATCAYCPDKIQLLTPFRYLKSFTAQAVTDDMITVDDSFTAVIADNVLTVYNQEGQKLDAKKVTPDDSIKCLRLASSSTMIAIYCVNLKGLADSLIQVSISASTINLVAKWDISTLLTIRSLSQMWMGTLNDTVYFALLEQSLITASQDLRGLSGSSVYWLTVVDTTISLAGQFKNTDFKAPDPCRINDFHIRKEAISVALCGIGVAFGNIAVIDGVVSLQSAAMVSLLDNQQINSEFLSNSSFMEVEILQTQPQVSLLVTTSTSLHYVLSFKLTDTTFKPKIIQKFGRYDAFPALKWHAITTKDLLLAYWDESKSKVTVAVYQRSTPALFINISAGIEFDFAVTTVRGRIASFSQKNSLFYSLSSPNTSLSRAIFQSGDYSLQLAYQQPPQNLSKITIAAQNALFKASISIDIQFEGGSSPAPWYLIAAIVLGALIVIGLLYFFYEKRRASSRRRRIRQESSTLLSNSGI